MLAVNNDTEKNFRDNQKNFGHINKPLDLISWLKATYSNENIKQIRYREIAHKFLSGGSKQSVLEVGAGVGDFVSFCSGLFKQNVYFANDLSEQLLAGNISKVLEYFNVDNAPELSFGSVENLGYPDGKFDVVFIKASVHHFENPAKGLSEIRRVLKPGGKLVFFEDPVCLNIPLYRDYVKRNFCLAEREMGLNENIYTIPEYLNFGSAFSNTSFYLDEVLVKEFDEQQRKRRGLKKATGFLLRINKTLFGSYLIKRFTSPIIFVFTK